jgi:hypothetical protein
MQANLREQMLAAKQAQGITPPGINPPEAAKVPGLPSPLALTAQLPPAHVPGAPAPMVMGAPAGLAPTLPQSVAPAGAPGSLQAQMAAARAQMAPQAPPMPAASTAPLTPPAAAAPQGPAPGSLLAQHAAMQAAQTAGAAMPQMQPQAPAAPTLAHAQMQQAQTLAAAALLTQQPAFPQPAAAAPTPAAQPAQRVYTLLIDAAVLEGANSSSAAAIVNAAHNELRRGEVDQHNRPIPDFRMIDYGRGGGVLSTYARQGIAALIAAGQIHAGTVLELNTANEAERACLDAFLAFAQTVIRGTR